MRPVFEILAPDFTPANCTLICEVSNEGFSYCIKDEEANSFLGLAVYHFDQKKPAVGFPIALQVLFHQQEVFSKKFKKVCVSYSFPQSVLIPFSMYNREKNRTLINMMFGDVQDSDLILTDVIADQSMYNCYRLPAAILDIIKTKFPTAVIAHQYSHIFKKPSDGRDSILVIFYAQKIVVDLVKDGKHLLINTFTYTSAQDVSYILLNICQQFAIKDIPLAISGLIEENSALYKEIYKYFNNIELSGFREGYQYAEGITTFPAHYFSYIFDIDPCE
jgi:hypothetical protein